MHLAIDLLAHNKPVETHTTSLNTPVLVITILLHIPTYKKLSYFLINFKCKNKVFILVFLFVVYLRCLECNENTTRHFLLYLVSPLFSSPSLTLFLINAALQPFTRHTFNLHQFKCMYYAEQTQLIDPWLGPVLSTSKTDLVHVL